MTWFPLFMDLRGKNCLLVGGGRVALHKAQKILSAGACVTLVAPSVTPEVTLLSAKFIRRKVDLSDLDGADLVIDATGDPAVGKVLYDACLERKIPINVVDMPKYCTFIFPAMLERGSLTAAISTGGASPIAASYVRNLLDSTLPEHFEDILDQMEGLRPEVKARIPSQPRRAAFLRTVFFAALEKKTPLSREELDVLWQKEDVT